MRFRATIDLNGKTATGIRVPPDVVAALDSGKRPAVHVTIAGYTYRTTVAPRGDRFLISVSAENRERAGVAAGDEVDVDLEVDTEPREICMRHRAEPPALGRRHANSSSTDAVTRRPSSTAPPPRPRSAGGRRTSKRSCTAGERKREILP